MGNRQQSRGSCAFCGREMTRGGLTRHVKTCPARQQAIAQADAGKGKRQTLYHLLVEDAWDGLFWLHLEMNGTARLEELDRYLRAIWLECCGHLSMFTYGGWDEEIPMSKRADAVFRPGVTLTHFYDFGTTSETRIRVLAAREGRPLSRHPIYLMARNQMPEAPCMECGQPARWLCIECQIEENRSGLLCDAHAEGHPHEDYGGLSALVNSPRLGMCGYNGPAEPPYSSDG